MAMAMDIAMAMAMDMAMEIAMAMDMDLFDGDGYGYGDGDGLILNYLTKNFKTQKTRIYMTFEQVEAILFFIYTVVCSGVYANVILFCVNENSKSSKFMRLTCFITTSCLFLIYYSSLAFRYWLSMIDF
jgi:hypothetical protein